MGRVSLAKELARGMGRGKVTFPRLILLAGSRFFVPYPNKSFFSPVLGSLSRTQTSEPARRLQSKQVKRSSQEWINKFIFANLISVVISIIRSSDK